jgi:hypothetical protein
MRAYFCTRFNVIDFEADLDVIPRVGEFVGHYAHGAAPDKPPTTYKVTAIVHAYDQRDLGPGFDPAIPHVYVRIRKTGNHPFRRRGGRGPKKGETAWARILRD